MIKSFYRVKSVDRYKYIYFFEEVAPVKKVEAFHLNLMEKQVWFNCFFIAVFEKAFILFDAD